MHTRLGPRGGGFEPHFPDLGCLVVWVTTPACKAAERGSIPRASTSPHHLEAQDVSLSRKSREFESRWGRLRPEHAGYKLLRFPCTAIGIWPRPPRQTRAPRFSPTAETPISRIVQSRFESWKRDLALVGELAYPAVLETASMVVRIHSRAPGATDVWTVLGASQGFHIPTTINPAPFER